MYGTLGAELRTTLDEITAAGLYKRERTLVGPQGRSIQVKGRPDPVLNFCANNYLGLSSHPRVLEAARAALVVDRRMRHGAGQGRPRHSCLDR